MKPVPFVAAATALLSAAVQAQSSVTLYGLIDMSVNYARFASTATRPSQHLYALSSDASRLGFRGVEDLGGGQSAYFKLETGVSLDTGTQTSATQYWNRETYVGLSDRGWGSLQLGSQFAPMVWNSGKVDPFGRFGLGSITGLLQGSPRGWAVTFNNAVQYISPNLGGFVGRLMVAPGEGAATGRSLTASAEYSRGPAYVTVNYDRTGANAAAVGLTGGTVYVRTVSVGGTYNLGPVKLAGWFQSNRAARLANVDGYLVGATVPVKSGELRASYSSRDQVNADASLSALGYYHFLSKRTWLFGQVGRIDNTGTAAFGLGPARAEEAAAGLLAGGRSVDGVQLGIRHFF
jgi:predicted porin